MASKELLDRQLQALLKILHAINVQSELKDLLELIIDTAIELMKAERGFLLVENMQVARHFDQEDISGNYKISQRVAQMVKRSGEPILTDNAQQDMRFSPYTSVHEHRLVSILCAPLQIGKEVIGVLYLDNRMVLENFTEDDLKLLSAFADQATIAIENARRARQIRDLNAQLNARVKVQTEKIQVQSQALKRIRQTLEDLQNSRHYHDIYARSPKMEEIFRLIEKIKERNLPVLIQGESGTGKELIARAIHRTSSRKSNPFVCENCAAIPESIFEAELFGYEKGAFTGANQSKKGLFEEADSGTLFLDEIGDLPAALQKKLLRVLAEKKIRRLGSNRETAIDVRIIAATNRNLQDMIANDEFREDLWYRLNVIPIELPPLRERREDIPLLVEHFLQEIARITRTPAKTIDDQLLSLLVGYHWPGNIRQLRNEIHRIAALSAETLSAEYLSPEIVEPPSQLESKVTVTDLPTLVRETERREIAKALKLCQNNKSKTSQILGITRFALQRKMEKYGIT